jgi:membrane protease YdiL (CAAX protease family)
LTSSGPDAPGPEPETPPPPPRPGTSTFTIEGRAAPALFVVGWLASISGIALILIGALSRMSIAPLVIVVGLVLLSVGLVTGAGSQGIERRARGVMRYQGPSPVLVFVASIPVSLLAGILVAIPLVAVGAAVDGPAGQLASVAVQALVYAGLIRLLVVDTGALSGLEMGVKRFDRRAAAEWLMGAAWVIVVIPATSIVAFVLVALTGLTPTSPLPPTGETSGLVLQLIAGAIVAPLGEELLFRGFATTAWVRAAGYRAGLVRGALLFAIAHILNVTGASAGEAFGLALVAFASRLPIAFVLGWLFLRRGTIWAPIGLHMAFNAILLVLGYLAISPSS